MFKFLAGNDSRMRPMPLATIHRIPPMVGALRVFYLCGLLLLTGCAVITPEPPDIDAEFTVQGKLLLALGGDKTAMTFSWRQNQDGYVIDVWGALGQGRTQLRGNAQTMQIVRGQDVIVAGRPEQVMQQQLGWSMPVDAMRYWLIGQPQPNTRFVDYTINEQRNSVGFRQNSWDVRATLANGEKASPQDAQPKQVEISRDDVLVRIRVSKYNSDMR